MKKISRKKITCYIVLFLVALFMCIPLFQTGIQISHDGDFHMSRVIGTLEQLKQGNSPFVISRFSNGLGFGWNLFYPPVSTLLTLIFTFLTNNIVLGIKLFIFCTFFLSGITMFQFVQTLTKNKFAGLLAGIFYMIAPYRLLNVYTRLAVGEMVSFIFLPIILNGVSQILKGNTRKSYLYVLGTIGLVLSHNISTMLVFFIGFFYVLINFKKLKSSKILKSFCFSTLIIILSVLFFEVPLLEQKSAVDLEVFRYGKMYSQLSVYGHALNPLQLLSSHASGADSSMYFCIGIFLVLGVLFSPFVKKYRKTSYQKSYRFFFWIGCIATVMSTFLFPWFFMPDLLLMIQFPWRMLVVIVFCFSILSGINWSIVLNLLAKKLGEKIKNTFPKIKHPISIIYFIAFTLLILLSCFFSLHYTKGIENKEIDNHFFEEVEIIDTKNQVSRYSSFLEYWPQKAIDSIEEIVNRDNQVSLLSGKATITNETKKNGILNFTIENVTENTTLELPYLFYKGYEIIYTPGNSANKIKLEATESQKGLVEIQLDSSVKGNIQVEYHATTLHKICIFISLTTFLAYLFYLLICHLKNHKNKLNQKKPFKKETISSEEKQKITIE